MTLAPPCYPNSKLFASESATPSPLAFTPKTDHTVPTDMSLVWAAHKSGLTSIKSERVAQVARQIHFLERELGAKDPERNGVWFDGIHWTYQRYRDLHEYFPHWPSERMVRDVVKAAEDLGLLISRKWNYFKLYRVHYAGVRSLCHQTGVEPPAWAFDEPEPEGVQLDIFVEDDVAQAAAEVEESRVTPDVTLDCHDASLQTDMARHPASLYTETNKTEKTAETNHPPEPPSDGGGGYTDSFMDVLEDQITLTDREYCVLEELLTTWAQPRAATVHEGWASHLLDILDRNQPRDPVGYAIGIVRNWCGGEVPELLDSPPASYSTRSGEGSYGEGRYGDGRHMRVVHGF